MAYLGGPYLRRPRVVTVSFAGDDPRLVSRLARLGRGITRTRWWRTVTAGYCAPGRGCIERGRPGRHVRLDDALRSSAHDVGLGRLLSRAVASGRLGPLDSESVLVYLPAGVRFADASLGRYCGDGPRALHRTLRRRGGTLPYAVVPRCGDEAALTATASQEILEATTNPDPAAPGFALKRRSATIGFTASGVEPIDPCGLITRNRHTTREGGFAVQRAWSNRAASLGRDPCLPTPADRTYAALYAEAADRATRPRARKRDHPARRTGRPPDSQVGGLRRRPNRPP